VQYGESVAYMQGLLRFGEKYGNERFEELLRRLNNPERQWPAIHIAGTKGKGSTTTFAATILRSAGYRTGSYLSPYVYDLRERVQLDGNMIPADDFARLVTHIRHHIDAIAECGLGPTTEFELKTAIAFCYFAEQKVDYGCIEVGLGGRLDATNVIPTPLAAVITNIGFDHVELLGHTLEQIAGEKAGIIKPGTVCVTGIEGGPAFARVREVCLEKDVPLHQVLAGRDWQTGSDRLLSIMTPKRNLTGINLRMRGQFQHANAAVAVHAIDRADIPDISDDILKNGLESAFAPGRLEVVHESMPTVILDAAHNELAAQVLADSLVKEFCANERDVVLVAGLSHRHEPLELLKPLISALNPRIVIATEPSFRPRPAVDIEKAAQTLGIARLETVTPPPAAARRAVEAATDMDDPLIIVTGSFFTIGDLPPSMWTRELFGRGPHL
jgi:dihydrofolate synthase/folylpolyglutamate synthase